ncbi:hypothetical protein EMPG_09287 [Blastomyces silverae]|uniref:Uncharacterized protein n=1 Tax=Blastomyces silverae TaxID=2060906 RepID=A0A0H1B5D4_9EURO|nr:hypothetical protein EMPG_09287 [Blastomyces silverae]
MANPQDYTIGWICALVLEYVAARAFLDEEHQPLDKQNPHDNNDYTLGRVGNHNVAIAVLPDGEYGTSSAATVARDMVHCFPNIRIGLMVGIGGGVPSRHDIRLGDIVVSSPRDGMAGVFQYDFGKTIQEENFIHTGFLNRPPLVLRAAVNGLKAQFESEGNELMEAVNSVLEKKPRLQRRGYKRPEPSSDRLYNPGFIHPPNNTSSCAVVCGDQPSKLTVRAQRTKDDDNPAIHYGLIASGNQLMKDATIRDKLAAEKDVLCFEMEAAGLMNHFPCLVVRGICDYSDSHKNDEWQRYAAMVAAAYARDLLYRLRPTNVEAEKPIREILSSGESGSSILSCTVRDLGNKHKQGQIERWLSPPDPSTNYNKALNQRHEVSGRWFLEGEVFKRWDSQRNSFLWLYGIPGCGKTILSSSIVRHLEDVPSSRAVLYFYFDFNDTGKQTLESMVRSLIVQLYTKQGDHRKPLDSLFSSCQDVFTTPTCKALCECLVDMMRQAREVWIVLDALDECPTRKTQGLLSWMRNILNSDQVNAHLLATSRAEQDIESEISEWPEYKDRVSIHECITGDICAYVHSRVRLDKGLDRWRSRPDVQDIIETRLTEKADGMFRWAACQLDALESCLDYDELTNALASLPDTLDATYARILNAIPDIQKPKAIRILQFLAFSERPLRIDELVDAIAVDFKKDPQFHRNYRMPKPLEVSRYCSSLVAVVSRNFANGKEERVLQLAHFSVKEYLTSDRVDKSFRESFAEINARSIITRVCLAYLSQLDHDENNSFRKTTVKFPLADYSALYWTDHARLAETEKAVEESILEFFQETYILWASLFYPEQPFIASVEMPASRQSIATPIYYASFAGLGHTLRLFLERGADVNAQGEFYGNALQAAAAQRDNENIVRMLLERGADVNAQGGLYGNALQAAATQRDNKNIVWMLLERGADVNAWGGIYGTALHIAVEQSDENIVQMLLERGADVNKQSGLFGKALQTAAAQRGNENIVQMLLDRGADINAQDGYYGTALQAAAAQRGNEDIVWMLLERGADVNAQHHSYDNVLDIAVIAGDENIVQMLLERGAFDNVQSVINTALQTAIQGGNEKIVQMLLKRGADVNAQGGLYDNALQAATSRNH